MKQKRQLSNVPHVQAGEFGAQWQIWWTSMQPDWRAGGSTWPFPRVMPAEEASWSRSFERAGGSNGFFLVLLTLSWWAQAVGLPSNDTALNLAIKDVAWVLRMIKVNVTQGGVKRSASDEAGSDSPAKKYVIHYSHEHVELIFLVGIVCSNLLFKVDSFFHRVVPSNDNVD